MRLYSVHLADMGRAVLWILNAKQQLASKENKPYPWNYHTLQQHGNLLKIDDSTFPNIGKIKMSETMELEEKFIGAKDQNNPLESQTEKK